MERCLCVLCLVYLLFLSTIQFIFSFCVKFMFIWIVVVQGVDTGQDLDDISIVKFHSERGSCGRKVWQITLIFRHYDIRSSSFKGFDLRYWHWQNDIPIVLVNKPHEVKEAKFLHIPYTFKVLYQIMFNGQNLGNNFQAAKLLEIRFLGYGKLC